MKRITEKQGKKLFALRKLLPKTISQYYCCGYCTFKSTNFDDLKDHLSKKHNVAKPKLAETKVQELEKKKGEIKK